MINVSVSARPYCAVRRVLNGKAAAALNGQIAEYIDPDIRSPGQGVRSLQFNGQIVPRVDIDLPLSGPS